MEAAPPLKRMSRQRGSTRSHATSRTTATQLSWRCEVVHPPVAPVATTTAETVSPQIPTGEPLTYVAVPAKPPLVRTRKSVAAVSPLWFNRPSRKRLTLLLLVPLHENNPFLPTLLPWRLKSPRSSNSRPLPCRRLS